MRRLLLCTAALCWAQVPNDFEAARWIVRQGGRVRLVGDARLRDRVADLPSTPFRVEAVDLIGASFAPIELKRLSELSEVRELLLPGPIFNPGAGSTLDANAELQPLASLRKLERLHFSLHFLTNINVQDKGLALLKDLQAIRELRLAQTRVKGSSLAAFANLEKLDLNYTAFGDEGVAHLRTLTKLNTLYLRDTLVTDKGMLAIGALTNLEYLDLSGARLTDLGVAALKPLTKLKSLNLLGAQLTDESAAVLAALPALEELNLYRAQITNAGLKKLEALKRLRHLDVRYTRVSRTGVDSLSKATPGCQTEFMDASASSATTAALRQSRPAGAGDAAVAAWVQRLGGTAHMRDGKLDRVDLSRTPVTDEQVSHLPASVSDLRLDSTEISDAALAKLPVSLRRLNLSHTAITAKGVASLPGSLEHLDLGNTSIGDSVALPAPLISLNLAYSNASRLTNLAALTRLTALDLTATDIENEALQALSKMTQLHDLRISYGRYNDKGIAALAELKNLERLEMVRTRLTDEGLKAIGTLPNLRALRLDYTNVSEKGVALLPPGLEELSLDTANIGDSGIGTLAGFQHLKLLNLYHTTITEAGFEKLKRALPRTRIIYDRDSSIPTRRKS